MNTADGTEISAACCVVGGGPAGMMLGLLLARAGVEVVVLEKHADFLRDFRGDTLHPSTLEVMAELGMLDDLLALPHQEVRTVQGFIGDQRFRFADFTRLPTRCRFVALMPQWDFLSFLAERAARWPGFSLRMQTRVDRLLARPGGAAIGVEAETPAGRLVVRSDLVIGADGRSSTVRRLAGLPIRDAHVPIDVLWLRLPRRPADPDQIHAQIAPGMMVILIDRGPYWQAGVVIRKGRYAEIRAAGLPALRASIARAAPLVADRVDRIERWDDVHLLTVSIDRLLRWWAPGVLCIGDAAHAMSPVGGVGINLAIQDAVAAANALARPLLERRCDARALARVQRRRALPTRVTQAIQVQIHRRVLSTVLDATGPLRVPLPVRLLDASPLLRRIPGRLIGIGFRPEHVESPPGPEGAPAIGEVVGAGSGAASSGAAALALASGLALAGSATPLGMRALEALPPLVASEIRLSLAAAALLPVALRPPGDWARLVALAAASDLALAVLVERGGPGAALLGLSGAALLGERLTAVESAGLLLAVAGGLAAQLGERSTDPRALGAALLLAAGAALAAQARTGARLGPAR